MLSDKKANKTTKSSFFSNANQRQYKQSNELLWKQRIMTWRKRGTSLVIIMSWFEKHRNAWEGKKNVKL